MENNIGQELLNPTLDGNLTLDKNLTEPLISKDNVSEGLKSLVDDVYAKESRKNTLYTPEKYMQSMSTNQQAIDSYFKDDNRFKMTRAVDINDIYANVGGDYLSRFPNYIYGTDNAERAARQQTTSEKWANGLTKAGSQLGSTVLGSTVGFLTGISNWASSGFDMNALYTDSFNRSLDEFNERLQYTLPNYYSKQEQDMNFFQSMGTANFWANDLSNGLAFTLGAIVSEAIWATATGGTSLAATAAKYSLRGSKFAKLLTRTNVQKNAVEKLLRASEQSNAVIQKAKRTYNIVNGANTLRFIGTSAGYEAGVEARQFMKEASENYDMYFQEEYGRLPNAQELAEFEKDLKSTANGVFAANVAVVGGSNLAVFGRMFKLARPSVKAVKGLKDGVNSRLFGIGTKTSKEGGKVAAEALKPNKLQKIAGYTQSFGKSAVVEGLWEEGSQSVIGNLADDWLSSGYEEEDARATYDFMGSLYDAYAHTYGSKEGWKEIGIGMIVGTIGGGISGQFGSYNRALKAEKAYATAINSAEFGAQATADRMMAYSRMMKANRDEQSAAERGDRTAEELARKRGLLSFIDNQDDYGRLDDTFENFKAAIEMTDSATTASENGITVQEVEDYKAAVLEEFKSLQETYADNKRFAEMVIGESPSVDSDIDKTVMSKAIAYNLTMGKEASDNADIFLGEFIKEVATRLSPEKAADFRDAANFKNALEKTSKEKRKNHDVKQREYNRLNRQKRELEKKIQSVQRKLSRLGNEKTDQKKQDKDLLLDLTEKLTQIESVDLPRAKLEWEAASNLIISTNPFYFTKDEESGFMVTSAERLNQISEIDENGELVGGILKNIDDSLQELKESDPKAYQRAVKMLDEYKKSVYAFKEFNKTIQGLSNPEFKPTNLVTKLSQKIAKARGKTENEFTREFFASVGASIITNTDFLAKQAAEEKIGDTTQTSPTEGDAPGTLPTDMTQKEFKSFRDTGKVRPGRLETIAAKIKKANQNRDKTEEEKIKTSEDFIKSLEKEIEKIQNSEEDFLPGVKEKKIKELRESIKIAKSNINNAVFSAMGLNKFERAVYLDKSKEIEAILNENTETSEIKRLENLIQKALEKNSAISTYIGDNLTEAENKKPTKEEMEEFKELHSRVKKSRFKSTSVVVNGNPRNIKESQGDNLNLSVEEIERYQELNNKLSSWQIQQGTSIDSIDATLGDLIIRLQQLRTTVNKKDTKSQQTLSDHIQIVKASDRNSRTSREDKGMIESPTEGVYISVENTGKRSLSHVTVEDFINKYLPKDSDKKVFIKLPGKKTKQEVEEIEQLTENQQQQGVTIFIEDSELGTITINVGPHSRLEFSKEQWKSIEDKITLQFLYSENDPQKNSYLMGYEKLSDGTFRRAESSFEYDTTEDNKRPAALPDEMYDTDSVQVFIDPKNKYNRELLDKLEKAKKSGVESAIKKAKDDLISNMYIHYMKGGKIIGVARAGTSKLSKSDSSDSFLYMRQKAADVFENTKQSNLIDMSITIPVAYTYYGSPIFNLVENPDGSVTPQPKEITKKDSDKIVDAGYVKNGKIFIGNKVDETEVVRQYLPNTDKKTPIIVFKYKGQNVAFPVALTEVNAGLLEPLNSIISNPMLTEGQKVNEINDFLIQNNIDPNDYSLREDDLLDGEKLNQLRQKIDSETSFADVETWAKEGFNLSRLRLEAKISIDISGRPFNNPKIRLDLAKMEYPPDYDDNGVITETLPDEVPNKEIDEFDALMNGEAKNRRDAGSYTKYGNTYTRQKEDVTSKRPKGKKANVKFADKVVQEVEYTLVEEEDLQPAHIGGYRNPNFFITEAQPKNRTDKVSKRQSDNIGNNPRFEELGESGIAYTGAPVINERGEVIQGNNRAEGLKKHYRNGGTKYKEDLANNASNFGLSSKQVEDMDKPVLVRVTKTEDNKSIELGNYEMSDIETGGRSRINPITTTRRIPRVAKRAITSALFRDNPNQTLNSAIRNNFNAVMNTLKDYLTGTQIDNLVDKEGNIKSEGIKDLENLIQYFLYSEGDSNLPSMFEEMSGTARNGIIKSLPKILNIQPSKSILRNIQNSIILYNTFSNSGVSDFNAWKNQLDIFEGKRTTEGFSELDLKIAENLINSRTEVEVKRIFAKYESEVNGVKADMFGTATEPKSKAEAVKNTFEVELEEIDTKVDVELDPETIKQVNDVLDDDTPCV